MVFSYNNTKNTNISKIFFELNYGYYAQVFLKDNINLYSKFCSANKLAKVLRKLINFCH